MQADSCPSLRSHILPAPGHLWQWCGSHPGRAAAPPLQDFAPPHNAQTEAESSQDLRPCGCAAHYSTHHFRSSDGQSGNGNKLIKINRAGRTQCISSNPSDSGMASFNAGIWQR